MQLFSRHEEYFSFFTSCNTNFRRTVTSPSPKWCGTCPKCAFVFLLLSAFLPKEKLLSIFGRNLYEDIRLTNTFRELLGFIGTKPFECVGTPDECLYALYQASQTGDYQGDPVFVSLYAELKSQWGRIAKTKEALLSVSTAHRIPVAFQSILKQL